MPQEREFANPKYVVRQILKALPKTTNEHDCWIGITILALWAHGNGFLDKGDLERGDIILLGTVSYSQVAEFCNCAYSTAKWRLAQLRDKWNLVRWHKRKKGIEYAVQIVNGLAVPAWETANEDSQTANGLPATQLTKDSKQLTAISYSGLSGNKSSGLSGYGEYPPASQVNQNQDGPDMSGKIFEIADDAICEEPTQGESARAGGMQ